jgi:hypothetical protein
MSNLKRSAVCVLGALATSMAVAGSAEATTYYACVKKKGGAIRIVSAKARCKGSERKIWFNSAGAPGRNGRNGVNGRNGLAGKNGVNGVNGVKGETGPAGPGATTFTVALAQGAPATLMRLDNGIDTTGYCNGSLNYVQITLEASSELHLQASGTSTGDNKTPESILSPVDLNNSVTAVLTSGASAADFDVIARDSTVGKFARLDVHGQFGSPCTFWGMIIPSV